MLTGGIISLVAAFTPITKLEEMVNIGTLMAFVIVCAAVVAAAHPPSQRRTPLPHAVSFRLWPARHPRQPHHDAIPAAGHLDSSGRLAGGWSDAFTSATAGGTVLSASA